jgi:hypothetical protein
MKAIAPVLLAFALAIPSLAQESKTNAAPAANKLAPAVVTLPASAGDVSKPLELKDGAISQPEQTELTESGKAVYSFTITNAGTFILRASVNAPDESSNSFFINIDAQPEDPLTIWDIDVTNGFEDRTVSWRGNGGADSDEFAPRRFKLSAGTHKLIIAGREPTQLKSISIHPAAD